MMVAKASISLAFWDLFDNRTIVAHDKARSLVCTYDVWNVRQGEVRFQVWEYERFCQQWIEVYNNVLELPHIHHGLAGRGEEILAAMVHSRGW